VSRIRCVGFTGTQEGMTEAQLEKLYATLELYRDAGAITFRHGDCQGADAQAHVVARSLGYRVAIHPPIKEDRRAFCEADEVFKPKPFLQRNHDIVDWCDVLVATPKGPEELRSGTWATVRYAKSVERPWVTLMPHADVPLP
jgi:hypothetical protein